jgi:RimJ/RimL family protein N-acetyltransferase
LPAAAVAERLQAEITMNEQHGIQYWPIFALATGEHVGCCGIRPYDPPARIHEFGVHIRSACWRRGYAHEASRAVIDHAFDHLAARGLFAGHHPGNDASRRLLEKLGFRHTHDEFYPPTGLMHPSYSLAPDAR